MKNIQDYKDAIYLTKYASLSTKGTTEYYVYCVPDTGMLYEVAAKDGTITGQRYALDITWDRVPNDLHS